MQIAYVNTDQVNQAEAMKMAKKYGAVVYGLRPKDPSPEGRYDAILYNLDDVLRHERSRIIEGILERPSSCPKAVHGYDVSEDEINLFRLHGVAVAQRLQPELVRILCRTAFQNLASVPPDDTLLEETWISLAE